MLFSWFKKNPANRRQTPRFSANPELRCLVSSTDSEAAKLVQMIDISESGFSFVIPAELFEIGEHFKIQMGLSNDQWIQAQGQIKSQHVYFPFGAEHYQKAVYRFSATFDQALESEKIAKVRQELLARARA
jgi:hypothetical protein